MTLRVVVPVVKTEAGIALVGIAKNENCNNLYVFILKDEVESEILNLIGMYNFLRDHESILEHRFSSTR